MNSLHPKTPLPRTSIVSGTQTSARLTAFQSEVEAIRTRIEPEVFFRPDQYKPVQLRGVTCRTSAQVVATYGPGSAHICTDQEWDLLGAFVRDLVGRCPQVAPLTAQRHMIETTKYVVWCHRNDVPARAEVMFTPERVEQYVATQYAHTSLKHRGMIRSFLRTIGIATTTHPGWHPKVPRTRAYRVPAPYTRDDLDGFWGAALAQSTAARRQLMTVMLTLGLGVGLRTDEVLELTATQIIDHPVHDGLLVVVLLDRLIPVRHEMADMVRYLCDEAPDGRLVGGKAENVKAYPQLQRMRNALTIPAPLPAFTMTRLRCTWAVACLGDGLNPAEFTMIAGTKSHEVFSQYAECVPVRETGDAWMLAASGLPTPPQPFGLGSAPTVKEHA